MGLCCPCYRSSCVPDTLPRARCLVFLWVSHTRVGAARGTGSTYLGLLVRGLYGRDRQSSEVGGGLFCRLVWCLGRAVAIIPVPRTVPGPALTGRLRSLRHILVRVLFWGGGGLCVVLAVVGGRFCRNLRIRTDRTPHNSLYTQCPRRSGVRAPRRPGVTLVLILRMRHAHRNRPADRRQPIQHTAQDHPDPRQEGRGKISTASASCTYTGPTPRSKEPSPRNRSRLCRAPEWGGQRPPQGQPEAANLVTGRSATADRPPAGPTGGVAHSFYKPRSVNGRIARVHQTARARELG